MLETARREFTSREAWRSVLAEFVATLLFVFLGAGSVIVSGGLPNGADLDAARLVAIALAHGLATATAVEVVKHNPVRFTRCGDI